MAAGYHDFTAGERLTASTVEDYLMLQTAMRFAGTAQRDAALSSVLTEGLLAYLIDTNTYTVYNGSAWSTIGPVHGVLTQWTPVITQSNTPAFANAYSNCSRVGRRIVGGGAFTLSATGTAANAVRISGFPAAATGQVIVGSGFFLDASTTTFYPVLLQWFSTTQFQMLEATVTGAGAAARVIGSGGSTFTAALASGDEINIKFDYEASGD